MTKDAISSQKDESDFKHPEKPIKIAYFILVHRFPEQFKRCFKAIYHPNNYYLIHLDKKANKKIHENVSRFLIDYPNVSILDSENVLWGGYSMVQVELNGIKKLLSLYTDWDFFINLSGQDFPLKSQDYIHDYLDKYRKTNFIKIKNQALERPETMNRVENYFVESDTNLDTSIRKRPFLAKMTPYIGGQWMILTRHTCNFFSTCDETLEIERFYRNTLIADESFFQTVMMNTSFNGTVVNDDKRAIIWIADGDIKLRPKTFTKEDIPFLLAGDNLFARKFDELVDSDVLAILEATLTSHKPLRQTGQVSFVS
ncbi:MAG: hypothetical protein RL662_411 [Bacteroidota bacterium]|jgi:hypothetical protein